MKTTPSPIAFLLHEDAFIADPREPLRKLLEHGCNPNTKCHVESDAEPTSEFEEEDEGFVCPDNTYKYPSALKPEKFERSIGIVEYFIIVFTLWFSYLKSLIIVVKRIFEKVILK